MLFSRIVITVNNIGKKINPKVTHVWDVVIDSDEVGPDLLSVVGNNVRNPHCSGFNSQ